MTKGFWEGKRVLVTGAGGFIASHLVEELVAAGAQTRAFVRYNSRNDSGLLAVLAKETRDKIEILSGDLRDANAVKQACEGQEIVFHLGALIAIPYSYVHPVEVVETNILGTLNILMAARDNPISRVIQTSTSEVYGSALRVPIDEGHPLQGQSPYAASKIGADKIAESFHLSYDVPVVTLRPFNTYGPRQSDRAVIPTIISQALTRQEIKLGNLSARRDLTYVSDTVDGFLLAGQTEGIEGQTINLGTGMDISIGELAEKIVKLIGKDVEIIVDETRIRPAKSEVNRLLSDNSRAENVMGWYPKVSLDQGLSQTIAWVASNLGFYDPERYIV